MYNAEFPKLSATGNGTCSIASGFPDTAIWESTTLTVVSDREKPYIRSNSPTQFLLLFKMIRQRSIYLIDLIPT